MEEQNIPSTVMSPDVLPQVAENYLGLPSLRKALQADTHISKS